MTGIHVPWPPTVRSTPSPTYSERCVAPPSASSWTSRRLLDDARLLIVLLLVGVAACGGPQLPTATPSEAGTPLSTGDALTGLAAHEDALLVVHASGSVVRVTDDGDLEPVTEQAHGLTAPLVAFGSLWAVQTGAGGIDVTEYADGSGVDYLLDGLVRIDPDTGTALAAIGDLGTDLVLAATDDAVWVAGERAGEQGWLWRIDPDTDRATVVQAGDGVRGDLAVRTTVLVAAGDRLWAAGNCDAMPCPAGAERLRVIDPATSEVTPLAVALPDELLLSSAAAIDSRVWFAGLALGQEEHGLEQPQGLLVAVATTGQTVHQLEIGRLPGLGVDDDSLWLTDCVTGTLTRLDPEDGAIVGEPILVGTPYPPNEPFDWYREDYACPGPLARTGDTLWVALLLDGTVVPVR
jgi:hypothetical protein